MCHSLPGILKRVYICAVSPLHFPRRCHGNWIATKLNLLDIGKAMAHFCLHTTHQKSLSSECPVRPMVLPQVDGLSDDEQTNDRGLQRLPNKVAKQLEPRTGFKRKVQSQGDFCTLDLRRLRQMISRKCGCRCQCFKPFNESIHLFEKWVALRKSMVNMTKLEKDEYVRIQVLWITGYLFLIYVSKFLSMSHQK